MANPEKNWYCTNYKGKDKMIQAGPTILANSEEHAQEIADTILRSHDGVLLKVLGRIFPDKEELSNTYITENINDLDI